MTAADRLRHLADFIDNHGIPEEHIATVQVVTHPVPGRRGDTMHLTADGLLPFILGQRAQVLILSRADGAAHLGVEVEGIMVWAGFCLWDFSLLVVGDSTEVRRGDVVDIVDALPDGVSRDLRGASC